MYLNKNFIYTTFDNKVDFWNTKPPLLIWIQSGLMHIFGTTEVAIRLPSAVSGIIISLIIFHFSHKYLKSLSIAFFSSIALFSIKGFVDIHALRTGDYDTILTLFSFCFLISMYIYSITKASKYLVYTNIFVTLAILIKGIAGLLIVPGIFLFFLYENSLILIIKNKHFIISFIASLIIIFGYYILREYYTPGYLAAVYENELIGRYSKTLEGNKGEIDFYLNLLFGNFLSKKQLILTFSSLPIAIIAKKHTKITLYLFLILISYLLIISLSATKLPWYLVPAYPLISILTIISILNLSSIFTIWTKFKLLRKITFSFIFIYVFGNSLMNNFFNILNPKDPQVEVSALSNHLRDIKKGKATFDSTYTFLNFEHYYPHVLFYQKTLGIKNLKIHNFNTFNIHQLPSKIAVHDSILINNIHNNYDYEIKKIMSGFVFYELKKIKYDWRNYQIDYNINIGNKDEMEILLHKNDSTKVALELNGEFLNKNLSPIIFKTINNGVVQTEVIDFSSWNGLKVNQNSVRFVQLKGKYFEI